MDEAAFGLMGVWRKEERRVEERRGERTGLRERERGVSSAP